MPFMSGTLLTQSPHWEFPAKQPLPFRYFAGPALFQRVLVQATFWQRAFRRVIRGPSSRDHHTSKKLHGAVSMVKPARIAAAEVSLRQRRLRH